MIRLTFQSLLVLAVLTVLTGSLYPLLVTGAAQATLPPQAHGSLIEPDGRAASAQPIGPPFVNPRHLWGPAVAETQPPDSGVAPGASALGPAAAACQAPSAAKACGLSEEAMRGLVRVRSNPRALFGEPRVDTAKLNPACEDVTR
jgi:K+-transporting ATPase c subunit